MGRSPSDELWARLRALEEHRNALQLAWVALARTLPEARRADLTTMLLVLADAATRKGEPDATALLRTMCDAAASDPGPLQ